jgi:phosphoribosylformylglycinamidine synthase
VKRDQIRVCVLRVGGTNCDTETKRAFKELGVQAEIMHVNDVIRRQNLLNYDVLVLPGGFSYGDYVRAGAIWAKLIVAKLGKELRTFVDEKRPILGICNGFQVLVEAGLLPGFDGMNPHPEAVLSANVPSGYNCRWIKVKNENNGSCVFTCKIPKGKIMRVPVAHAEGRFMFAKPKERQYLKRLHDNDQLVFRYCYEGGEYAEGSFPANPNGSFHDIAGICDPEGTVLGLMPHPERAFYWWQQPDWTRHSQIAEYGDGKLIFESLISHLENRR